MKPELAALAMCMALLIFSEESANGKGVAATSSNEGWQFNFDRYAELRKAPEKAANRANPLENDPDAVAAGGLLFEDHCAECHGDDARGARKGPSLRVTDVQDAKAGTLFWLLTNGVVRKKMPAWSKLPEPQRWQLVRYLQSLR
jgi:mono/diheme cytochrome c family protein